MESHHSHAQASLIEATVNKGCINRIQTDLKQIFRDPLDGILVVPDEDRANYCHALILGPSDTPYENGFFYVTLNFPFDYPHNPPKVKLRTTGAGRVRFNPNFYKDGTVCLSILGTWEGPCWSPVHTISSILLSIQSLMNDKPYHNEPGFENVDMHGHIPLGGPANYNRCIRHETVRIAIIDMINMALHGNLPGPLAASVKDLFVQNAETLKYTCDEYSFLDGREFLDPFHTNAGTFRFAELKRRIDQLEQLIQVKPRKLLKYNND